MKKAVREPFRLARRIGIFLTAVAWAAFLVSFFLPVAAQIGSLPGAPLGLQSGWQTFVDSLMLSMDVATSSVTSWGIFGINRFQPLVVLCLLSPVPNGLMLLAPPANLKLRHNAAFLGAFLFLSGVSAFWVCWQVYEGLTVGFHVWIGSILVMAVASSLIGASWFMEDNVEHERLLAELKKTQGNRP